MSTPATETEIPRTHERRLLAGAIACSSLALLTYNAVPLIIGSMIDGLGLDPARAGLIGTAEIGALAFTSLALAPRMHAVGLRSLGLFGAAAVLATQLGSMAIGLFAPLLALRAGAGVASGAVYAAVNAAVARTADPDRTYAKLTFVAALIASAIFTLIPLASTRYGTVGTFGILAAVTALFMPFALWLPASGPRAAPSSAVHTEASPLLDRHSVALMAAVFLASTGGGGLWAFTERIAVGAGLSAEEIGLTLGVTTLVATGGALFAAWLGTRVGRTLPLVGAQVSIGIAGLAIGLSPNATTYITAQLVYNILFVFLLPYVLGTGAALDPWGRLAAAVGGSSMVGAAIGPAIVGTAAEYSGYWIVGVIEIACALGAAMLMWPVTRRLDREGPREI